MSEDERYITDTETDHNPETCEFCRSYRESSGSLESPNVREFSIESKDSFVAGPGMEDGEDALSELLSAFEQLMLPTVNRTDALKILLPILDAGVEYIALEGALKFPELMNTREMQGTIRSKIIEEAQTGLRSLGFTGREIDDAVQYVMDEPQIPFRQNEEWMRAYPIDMSAIGEETINRLFPGNPIVVPVQTDDGGDSDSDSDNENESAE